MIVQHAMSEEGGGDHEVTLHLLRARAALLADSDQENVIDYVAPDVVESMFLERMKSEVAKEVPDPDPEIFEWPESMPLDAPWPPALLARLAISFGRRAIAQRNFWQEFHAISQLESGLRALCGSDPWTI
jgi:hypothetical protein